MSMRLAVSGRKAKCAGRKGYYFSLDAFLAASLLLLGLFLMSSIYVKERTITTNYFAQDTMRILSGLTLGQANNSYINALISNGTIGDSNLTILEQVGAFWAENKTFLARQVVENITAELIPENYGFAVYADGELIYSNNKSLVSSQIVSKTIVSGITKDKPFKGYSSKMVLTSIQARTTNSYSYFGGFTGEGNISQKLVLPGKVSKIKEAYLEADASNNFTLYINSFYSGTYIKGSSGGGAMKADKWLLNSSYLSNFRNGTNSINISFSGTGYIAGGYLRVTYNTAELNDTEIVYFQSATMATKREWLPGINGIINLYSSLYAPGNITAMTAHLHYKSDFLTYLTIGNTTVLSSQGSGDQVKDMSDAELTVKLNYTSISEKTVPIRMGSGSGNQTITGQGTADIVLASDASGSMEWCSGTICSTSLKPPAKYCNTIANYRPENGTYCDWWIENYTLPDTSQACSARWHAHCTSNDTRKIDIALNASKLFAGTVLGTIGNRLGTVEYTNPWDNVIPANGTWGQRYAPFPNSIVGRQNLTSNSTLASQHLDKYLDAYWGTCICCGVVESVDILTKLSNSSRKRAIVIMSDGEATDKCTGVGTGNAKADAIKAAQDACTNYNITVYTVGFGTDVDAETLQSMAACNGSYYNATDVQQLANIYKQIADQLVAISYSAQQINATGTGNFTSILYDDSYIEINYTPSSAIEFSKIPITLETDRFGNNVTQGALNVPDNTTVASVRVTSYSGDKWTDNLTISNTANYNSHSLASWGNDYTLLGDPFIIDSKSNLFRTGTNTIKISTGLTPANYTGGSIDNKAIYTLNVDASTSYTTSLAKSEGCTWTVSFEDGTNATLRIPASYNGAKQCSYEGAAYDADDAIDLSAYWLFQRLDLEKNGKLNVVVSQEDLQLTTATVQNVPSLWGPAIIEARLWQ